MRRVPAKRTGCRKFHAWFYRRGKLLIPVESNNLCVMTRGPQDVGPRGGAGPSNPTPLALAFYKAWRSSGLTLEAVATEAGLSVPTVWAYINGTRGSGGQPRQRRTIAAIAGALNLDEAKMLTLAGQAPRTDVVDAIKADTSLPRRDKEMLIMLYEQRRR